MILNSIIECDVMWQVSRTLDFGFADYAVSKAFEKLAALLPDSSAGGVPRDTEGACIVV